MSILQKFNAVRDAMKASLLERDTECDLMIACYLSGQHMLMLGPPGTAKSLTASRMAEATSAEFFSKLLMKSSVDSEIFGPWSLKGLENDRFERVKRVSSILGARVAFLDEIWKGGSGILNGLLTIANEREYDDGTNGRMTVPLEMIVAASNELPQDDSLEALYDRFLVRRYVDRLKDDENVIRLLTGQVDGYHGPSLSEDDVQAARQEVAAVTVDRSIAETIVAILRELGGERGIYISDRRWQATVKFLKAWAWMQGDAAVTDDHLEMAIDCLWYSHDQRRIIEEVVAQHAHPVGLDIRRHLDAAQELFDNRGGTSEDMFTACSELKRIKRAVEAIGADDKITAAAETIETLRKVAAQELSQMALDV